MLHDACGVNALPNQLVLYDVAIGDYTMRQTKSNSLCALLHRSAEAVGLAFRSNPRSHARQKCPGHSEDVRVKAMGVHDVDLVCPYETLQTAKLFDEVEVVETG